MSDRLPRKLAAILYADVAGYSRLTGEDEDETHRTLSDYLNLISQSIQSHHGQVMHYAGDAVLARFDSVMDAMTGAVAIQNELKVRNADLSDDRKLQFRIGVNLGDVIEDRGDIYGEGVNVAARLESLADVGGICISDAVRTAIGTKLALNLDSTKIRRLQAAFGCSGSVRRPPVRYRYPGFGDLRFEPTDPHDVDSDIARYESTRTATERAAYGSFAVAVPSLPAGILG